MFNRIIISAVAVIAALQILVLIKVFYTDSKIAYIDTGKLLEKSKDMQVLRKQLEMEKAKLKSNIDTLSLEFEKQLKSYEANLNTMSGQEKQHHQDLLRSRQAQLMQYQQAIEQKVQQEEQKKSQEVLTRINTYISEYGADHGYKLVFATSQGNIAYGDKGIDITDKILNGINQ